MILADTRYFSDQFIHEEKNLKNLCRKSEFNNKYKTLLCNNWQRGECKFGDGCMFAHGEKELKINSQKTIDCKNFQANHFCPYGFKCQYKHSQVTKKRLQVFAIILLNSALED